MKVLFVCNQGKYRSRTAAKIFKDEFETKYAGLYSEDNPLTKINLAWADTVVVMEEGQRKEIGRRFPGLYMKKRIICLSIHDIYRYMHPDLINILKKKLFKNL